MRTKASIDTIYEPKGKAREYGSFAVNLFTSCPGKCKYCYVPGALRQAREKWEALELRPRNNILERIEANLQVLDKPGERIFMCFTCDPFPNAELAEAITVPAIQICHKYGYGVRLLTKNGDIASKHFHELGEQDEYGVTLTCNTAFDSRYWEPGASLPIQRIMSLQAAKRLGIPTWASFEPVLYPKQSLLLMGGIVEYCDSYRVGCLNHAGKIPEGYRDRLQEIDWADFGAAAIRLLEQLGKPFYIKADLRRHLRDEDFWKLRESGWGKVGC